MTSPIEYQRNHVGGGGSSGPPSSSSSSAGGLPGGSSTNNTSNSGGGGGGGGGGGSGGNSNLCGPRSRPSRIPQPSSRLPQPVHHHHPPGPEGPDRSAGMWSPCHPQPPDSFPSNCFSDSATNGELPASEVPKMRMDSPHGSSCSNSNRPFSNADSSVRKGGCEETQRPQTAAKPQMTVVPLNFPLKSPRVGTVSPLMSSPAAGAAKELILPSSPVHKGNPFWAVVPPLPPSPASRPGSCSFPSDNSGGGDSLGRGSHGTPSHHRHSSHNKDVDRMSTCSSTSEQSVHSTQSNGVRR